MREGSRVVTPVIQFTEGLGPTSILWGSDEENQRYLQEQSDKWLGLREALMVYVNHHPREAVRALGEEVEQAVSEDLNATAWLLMNRKSEVGLASYTRSDQAHANARARAGRADEGNPPLLEPLDQSRDPAGSRSRSATRHSNLASSGSSARSRRFPSAATLVLGSMACEQSSSRSPW